MSVGEGMLPGTRAPSGWDESLDEALQRCVVGVRAGDRAALPELMELVRPHVLRYARRRSGLASTGLVSAEDITQEACLALVKAIPGYRSDGRPFLVFAYGITAHKISDAHRRRARDRSEPVGEFADAADGAPGPEQRLLDGELRDRAAALVSCLPSAQQRILHLRIITGLSAEETAQVVGSTPGAVRVAQHRALSALRRKLAARGHAASSSWVL